jgi:hypothetical protein
MHLTTLTSGSMIWRLSVKVGDLVMYGLGSLSDLEELKDVAVVVADRHAKKSLGIRSFLMFYPHYNEYVVGWEDEYRVCSESR